LDKGCVKEESKLGNLESPTILMKGCYKKKEESKFRYLDAPTILMNRLLQQERGVKNRIFRVSPNHANEQWNGKKRVKLDI
jgi:hypothetical protein